MEQLFYWVLDIIYIIADLGSFLTTNIEGLGMSPLMMLTVGGFFAILALHVVHLVNPLG